LQYDQIPLTTLSLILCQNIDDRALEEIAKKCGSTLLSIVIDYSPLFTDKGVQALIKPATKLHTFSARTKASKTVITDETMFTLAQYCSNLTKLDVSGRTSISDTGINSVISRKSSSQLKILDISSCDLEQINDFSKCTNLLELRIEGCHKLNVPSILSILKKTPKLEMLGLAGCNINFEILSTFAAMKSLTALNLSACQIYDAGLLKVATSAPQLKILILRQIKTITSEPLADLVSLCPNLQLVDLCRVPNLSYNDFMIMLKKIPQLIFHRDWTDS